jgi:hypothetical protein
LRARRGAGLGAEAMLPCRQAVCPGLRIAAWQCALRAMPRVPD